MSKSILIVGHSHIRCLMVAWEKMQRENPSYEVEFVDLIPLEREETPSGPQVGAAVKRRAKTKSPDYVCQCVNGNFHNVLSIVEHPNPFSVGEAIHGAAPADPDRWFIPSSVIADVFSHHFARAGRVIKSVFNAFPEATHLYLNPPPPVTDWEHIKKFPDSGAVKIEMGPAPVELKVRLYELQTEFYAKTVKRKCAAFIESPEETRTPEGGLAPAYFEADPTHGNADYGRIMLNRIFSSADALSKDYMLQGE